MDLSISLSQSTYQKQTDLFAIYTHSQKQRETGGTQKFVSAVNVCRIRS